MPDAVKTEGLLVSPAEDGMKLLRFLECRLGFPKSALHRFIRTGQVRINGKRAKPFDLVTSCDNIRIPPFAFKSEDRPATAELCTLDDGMLLPQALPAPRNISKDKRLVDNALLLIAAESDILVLHKKSGLPTQPGSGWEDCASARLASFYSHNHFIPSPAHRLDKWSSGILLAGKTHAAQKYLHEILSGDEGGGRQGKASKTYMVWVHGQWTQAGEITLKDYLALRIKPQDKLAGGNDKQHMEQMAVVPENFPHAQYAECMAIAIQYNADIKPAGATLLKVTLLTGRKHQIRIQFASRGHPVLGDTKYCAPGNIKKLMLHAWRICLPDGRIFTAHPDWTGGLAMPSESLMTHV